MSELISVPTLVPAPSPFSRRRFFGSLGLGAAAVAVVASGCDTDDPGMMGNAVVIDLSDDFGILNFAYALEQLEYAFYQQVVDTPYDGIISAERTLLTDIRDHEESHVDFFATAIPALGGTLIPNLTPDFGDIDFSDRTSVLSTAQTFEDLGVSAYNGAGQYLVNPDLLVVAGKIVSVEARHAAAIRSMFQSDPRAFAGDDVVDPATGLDVVRTFTQVLTMADPFIATEIELDNIPS